MAEDDVEVIIDAELGGNAAQGLAAAADQAERLAAAMARAQAAGTGFGQGVPAQMPGETPFSGPRQPGNESSQSMAMAQQGAAMQAAAVDNNQQVNQAVAAQLAEDQESGDASGGGHAVGWRGQMHGLRMLAGGDANLSKAMMGGMGVSGRFGAAGVVGGGMEIATAGMAELSKFTDIIGNSFMSATDKAKAFTEALPIVGNFFSAIYAFADSLNGVGDRLRQQQYDFDMQQASQTAFYADQSKISPIKVEQAQAEAAAAAAQGILPQYGAMPSFLQTQDYQAATAQNALEDRRVALERQQAAALAGLGTLQNQAPELDAKLAAAKQQEANARDIQKNAATVSDAAKQQQEGSFAAAYTKMGGPAASLLALMDPNFTAGVAPGLDKAGKDLVSKDLEAAASATAAAKAAQEANITAEKQKQGELDKIAAEQGALRIDQLKQELSIIEQQVNKAKSQYEGIGGLDDASKQNALLALQQAQSLGIQSLTSEQKGLIGSVPGGADKLKELQRDYAGSADQIDITNALRQAVATSGTIDQAGAAQSLPELLAAQAAKAAEIKTQTQANAVASTGDTAGTVKAFGDQLIAAITAATAAVKKHTEDKAFEKQQGTVK